MDINEEVSAYAKVQFISRTPGNRWETGKHDVAPKGKRPNLVERGATYRVNVLNVRGEVVLTNREYSVGSGLTHDKLGCEVAPSTAAILHAFLSDADAADGTLQDFCDNFGYDIDSRKALATYLDCQEVAAALTRGFNTHELTAIHEVLENY